MDILGVGGDGRFSANVHETDTRYNESFQC